MGAIALEREIPGYGFSTDMSAHWSIDAHLDKFDKTLAWKQITVATQLTGELIQADLKEISVKMTDKANVSFGFENDQGDNEIEQIV